MRIPLPVCFPVMPGMILHPLSRICKTQHSENSKCILNRFPYFKTPVHEQPMETNTRTEWAVYVPDNRCLQYHVPADKKQRRNGKNMTDEQTQSHAPDYPIP